MDLKAFKAGGLVSQPTGYKSFIPILLNHTFTWEGPSINTFLEEATLQPGGRSSFARFVPNIAL